jgi:membrane associated rhomboid family serine protease
MARRFQFNVPERRGDTDPWFTIGTLEVTTTVLVALLAGISFFVYAINKRLLESLFLYSSDVRSGQVWRIVTWPLVNQPTIWGLLTLVLFWWFGRDLEAQLGRNRFLWLVISMVVGGGLLITLIGNDASGLYPLFGFRFIEVGVFVAYVADHARARFMFNIPGWVVAAVIVGLDVLQLLGDRLVRTLLAELFIIAIALIVTRAYGLATDTPWVPKLNLPGSGPSGPGKKRAKKGKAKLASVPVGVEQSNARLDISAQFEMDSLLDKISAGGMESLTSAERKRLEQLSKQLRGK